MTTVALVVDGTHAGEWPFPRVPVAGERVMLPGRVGAVEVKSVTWDFAATDRGVRVVVFAA